MIESLTNRWLEQVLSSSALGQLRSWATPLLGNSALGQLRSWATPLLGNSALELRLSKQSPLACTACTHDADSRLSGYALRPPQRPRDSPYLRGQRHLHDSPQSLRLAPIFATRPNLCDSPQSLRLTPIFATHPNLTDSSHLRDFPRPLQLAKQCQPGI
jgi:hypothetical protein